MNDWIVHLGDGKLSRRWFEKSEFEVFWANCDDRIEGSEIEVEAAIRSYRKIINNLKKLTI